MADRFRKVLVANRGEIAVRCLRGIREEGLQSVAVFSDADRSALFVRFADEAIHIGASPSAQSYLRMEAIVAAAARTGATAVHPGYGFLSENAGFAAACEAAGLVFIGPTSDTIRLMGNKLEARAIAERAGVPIIPGSPGPVESLDDARAWGARIGYPIMIKAASGGGGKGMRVVHGSEDLARALELTRGEAQNAFADATIYMESYIEQPRHIEIQIMGDAHGNVVHLGERECTLQRRHQKVIEEAPSMWMTPERRRAMGEAAVRLAKAVGYRSAGTVEFVAAPSGQFYFLEMNTRLQVEHPVTELVYGVDLVREQLRVAAGEPLSWKQEDLVPKGWAIECRIYAEDPYNRFLPSLGTVTSLRLASGPGIRNDVGIHLGSEVSRYYDPLLGKLIAFGKDREEARRRMFRGLRETLIEGVRTNISFHRWLLNREEFIRGDLDTGFIERTFHGVERREDPERLRAALVAAVITTFEENHRFSRIQDGQGRGSNWRLLGRPGKSEEP
ncbi:MAG TPA: acetyl-CoA carboxylase biotin carboxylase subunit [Candidatus Eisenbacteria bacterium]|nr:acetyl-CoA carboxylase biotin carboxylase subunit [Candidatus Eisenbacteria bacterium]